MRQQPLRANNPKLSLWWEAAACAALLLAALFAACAGGPPASPPGAKALRPDAADGAAPDPAAGTGSQPAPDGGEAPYEPKPVTTVIIEPGSEETPSSLVEASRRAREQRKNAPPPIAVIDNDNLSEYAERGNLTIAHRDKEQGQGQASGRASAGPPATDEPLKDEAYWREGARELRLLWRQAADEIEELQQRAEALRRQFYSEDDPYVRDTRIKPSWDRVLDRLEETRLEVDERRAELAAFMEEGRQSGALPGWLREGIELEPEAESPDAGELPSLDPTEPVTREPVPEEGGGRP